MNSGDYYLEFRRKSFEFEENFGTETAKADLENTDDNLLNDYELVTNEEIDETVIKNPFVSSTETVDEPKNYIENQFTSQNQKLSIQLGAEEIALKSQIVKFNKSIVQETETQPLLLGAVAEETALAKQHVPFPFTIVPIDVNHTYTINDGNEYPEIVLNSFKTNKPKKQSASVTFCSAFKTQLQTNLLNENQQQTGTTYPTMLPLSTKPPEVTCGKAAENEAAVTVSETKKLHETYDDSEFNSLPGSSTSPESYVDNILSAASSASVRSSSLSSGAEMTQFLSAGGGIDVGVLSTSTNVARGVFPVGGTMAKQQQQRLASTNKMNTNRALNSKCAVLNNNIMSTTIRQPIVAAMAGGNGSVGGGCGGLEQRHQQQNQQPIVQPPAGEPFETISSSSSLSPSQAISVRVTPDPAVFPENLKCILCAEVFRDPRTLNCLHSFCFQCLVDENFSSIPFWSQLGADEGEWKTRNHSNSLRSSKESSPDLSLSNVAGSPQPLQRQRSSFSFRRKKSLEKPLMKSKSDGRSSSNSSPARPQTPLNNVDDKAPRLISCKVCNYSTEIPLGGLRQLPQNFLLVRKIEEIKLKAGDEVITRVWCSLCFEETNATYHCVTCTLNLCTLCKEAHERQRSTADHKIKNILELRRARKKKQNILNDNLRFKLKCGMHPGFEIKSFCATCLQLACSDCLVLLHKSHKHEPLSKAFANYSKIVRESTDQTRPLCSYAQHSIGRLHEIGKNINQKCDCIQAEVETFMSQYFDAVEVHRKTLLQQVQRARESKVEMILEQQLDLEKRTTEAMDAVRFSQELIDIGSDVELLSFVNILLKRFEYCSQFKAPQDPKISDSLHFLPHIRAPSTKTQNNIPLYGIITMQTVEPVLCTLDSEAFAQLRLHKKAELVMQSRDAHGVPLCHGGLQLKAKLKYKEYSAKSLPVEVSDNRDGTYGIAFVPDSHGTMLLTVTINDSHIKGSPFTFLARSVRPHNGIYHCCAFCSSKGSKLARCSCKGRMPGYNGCGHGHAGHPGRRHWSCCGNVLENSECTSANMLLV